MDNNKINESEHYQGGNSQPLPNEKSVENVSFEDACKYLEAVALEIAVADQQIIDVIRKRLHEENVQFNSSVIHNVCEILGKFNRSPSLKLLEECLKCFEEPVKP